VTAPRVGSPAPSWTLPLLDGGSISLADQKGSVVIVNFWASWCEPCLAETPRLAGWYNKYHPDGLNILGVNVLSRDSRATVTSFVKDRQVAYPIPLDERGTVTAHWLVQQLPRSYVIDRDGVVRFVRIGELTDDDLKTQVLPLLQRS
jgi:peroxiredoxin